VRLCFNRAHLNRAGFAGDLKPEKDESHGKEQDGQQSAYVEKSKHCSARFWEEAMGLLKSVRAQFSEYLGPECSGGVVCLVWQSKGVPQAH
jgi:hypothetical protein